VSTGAQNLRDIVPLSNSILTLRARYTSIGQKSQWIDIITANNKGSLLRNLLLPSSLLRTNNNKIITNTPVNKFGNNTIEAGYINIDKQLKPSLIKLYENTTAFNLSKCNNILGCPVIIIISLRSEFSLKPTLGVIGNVSKSTAILILNHQKVNVICFIYHLLMLKIKIGRTSLYYKIRYALKRS
jgi:hypothetical protein